MKNSNIPEKAYRNIDFLTSQDARIIRILSEILEPQARFKKYNIIDTIVFFGSARLFSKEDANEKLSNFKKSKITDENYDVELSKLETLVKMSK